MLQPASHVQKHRNSFKFDVFQYFGWLRLAGNVMILAVLGLVGMAYAAIIVSYGPRVLHDRLAKKLLSAIVIMAVTFLGTMTIWAYLVTVFTDPGSAPPQWHPFATQQEEEAMRDRVLQASTASMALHKHARYCRKCHAWRPPRAHHCSVLSRCVLKMDHFCLWVVNTVGLLNYKAFFLFLAYSLLFCILCFAAALPPCVQLISHHRSTGRNAGLVFMTLVLSFTLALALLLFLGMHGDMVAHNYTSIETLDHNTTTPWVWDKGPRRNIDEVFGRRRNWWWLPILSRQDREWMLSQALDVRLHAAPFLQDSNPGIVVSQSDAVDHLV